MSDMTVRELISVLKKCQPDATVWVGPHPDNDDHDGASVWKATDNGRFVYLSLDWSQ